MADLSRTFAALADPTRLAIVQRLQTGPARSSELAVAFTVSRPAMSRHLRTLRESGLVVEAALPEDARARVYQLRPDAFLDAHDWLDEVTALWTTQLEALKAYAESKGPS